MENYKWTQMEKKKISAFEFAIMEVADPDKAKECEPLTKEEEDKIRYDKIMSVAKRMKIKNNTETINQLP